ncbi:hypothetical protein ACUTAF_09140 [Pseudomonas sp. SP16.1]|uniref:hypothetical protein n=1 Tax=Pseudomonas sp. SP16.1 TaxID=3458854 RepID=UPI004045E7F4
MRSRLSMRSMVAARAPQIAAAERDAELERLPQNGAWQPLIAARPAPADRCRREGRDLLAWLPRQRSANSPTA